jgi:hypothetical protein
MATQVQFRRGTTAQNDSFTGAVGELSVDTDVKTIRIHDGSTAGGFSVARSNLSNVSNVGVLTATDFNSTSDISLKENIKTLENPIEKIMKLNGVSFDWKESGSSSIGVIAQEIEKVLPQLVSNGEVKSVNYNGLIGVLIEAVKEQQRQIEELKKQIDTL